MATPQQQKIRRIVWTGAISSVVFVGSIYGAGLKIQQDHKTLIQDREVASYDDRIAALEEQRSALVAKRITLERKVQEVEAKAKGEAGKGQERRLN